MTIYYDIDGKNYEFTVSYVDDPTCYDDPVIKRMVEHIRDTAEEVDAR